MPDETSFAMKSSPEQVIEELAALPPQTPVQVRRGETARLTSGGILVLREHYSVIAERDRDLNPAWKERERRKYTSQAAWDREQEIVDEAGGGERVFADILVTHWNQIVIEDPRWRPDPNWQVLGGFDHGKTNPTALLRAYVDFEGTIIFGGEYYAPGKEIWQHAPEIKRMTDFARMETIWADRSIFTSDLQQSQRPGHAIERAKSFAQLYGEQAVENLIPFSGDASDVSFAGRIHQHWADLDKRQPSVKILCPKGMYADKPQPGLHSWGCPNLLWELMVARRVKLTAQQLLSRNVSEAIVDKDNHARDAMKYLLMSLPEPSQKSLERRAGERIQEMIEKQKAQGVDAETAATNATIQYQRILREEQEEDGPQYYGGSARRRMAVLQRRLNRAGR
jgi:hypothetical protein